MSKQRQERTRWPRIELPPERWRDFGRRTVVETSLALLSHVALVDGDGRSVGLPYTHICEVVRALHPGARTTVPCLRWYVGHVMEGEFEATLPQAQSRSPANHPLNGRAKPA